MIGHKFGTPIGPTRRAIVKKFGQISARTMVFWAGLSRINIERPEIDYTKYLGEDWVKTYEGESTLINNHSSWFVNILM